MKKKGLALALALVLVVACAVGGTLAWLNAKTDPVTNTFTTSGIDITLTETTGKEYKMVPGYTISKDPTVTVEANSEACYLFVKVETSENFGDFLTYKIADGWTLLDGENNVWYRVVEASDKDVAFSVLKDNQVSVKNTVTNENMNGLTADTYPTLTVTAYASQYYKNATENFTASEAWTNISSGN